MKRILFLFFLFLLAGKADSAVVFDAASAAKGQVHTLTWSHTTTASANRVLFVFVTTATGTSSIASVTHNGTAVAAFASATSQPNCKSYLYRLVAPASGTFNIVVTLSGAASVKDDLAAIAVTFSGVDQLSPAEPIATANGFSTGSSINVPTPYAGDLPLSFVGAIKNANTPGAGQTELIFSNQSADYSEVSSKASTGVSTNMICGIASISEWEDIGVALRPVALYQ
jgi:hypothetical protein